MPITVEAYAQYLTVPVAQMRGTDYDGQVFVHALKGHPFTNYATIRAPDGTWTTIDPQHPEVATEIFVAWAYARIRQRHYAERICLVPVPNKSALISTADQPFPTLVLAESLWAAFSRGVTMHPVLRWRRALQTAQSGGSRGPWALYPELVFVPPPHGTPTRVVLVDDVCTEGGHLQACAARLSENGYVADYGVCGGRTLHDQQADPFSLPAFTLEDYVPGSIAP
jgi:hypothetical protein